MLVSDSPKVRDEVKAVIDPHEHEVVELSSGWQVRETVSTGDFDLAVLDSQIGSMGAMAVCLDLRLEESGDRLDHIPVLMLLDRRADVFLARRSQAEGWLVKPLDPIRIRKALEALLSGNTFHDAAYRPLPLLVGPQS